MNQRNFTRDELQKLPVSNYREITNELKKGLPDLAIAMMKEGQLTPIIVGRLGDHLRADGGDLAEQCDQDGLVLVAGMRRLLAFRMMPELATEELTPMDSLRAEIVDIETEEQFIGMQMSENMNRQNTLFTEDGKAFAKFLEYGEPAGLFSLVNFPTGYVSEKQKLDYVNSRILAVETLDKKLWPYLNRGLVTETPKRGSQVNLIAKYPGWVHVKLAKEYKERKLPMGWDKLTGFLNSQGVELKEANFDIEDESLAPKSCGTGSCIGCQYNMTVDRQWGSGKEPKCFLPKCFKGKTDTALKNLTKEVKAIVGDFFHWAGQKDYHWGKMKEVVDENTGQMIYHGYIEVEHGACPHTVPAVAADKEKRAAKGLMYICPQCSNCSVHWKERLHKQERNRVERMEKEKSKTQKRARNNYGMTLLDDFVEKLNQPRDEKEAALAEQTASQLQTWYEYAGMKKLIDSLPTDKRKLFSMWMFGKESLPFNCWYDETEDIRQHLPTDKLAVAMQLVVLLHQWDTKDRDKLLDIVGKLLGENYYNGLKVAIKDALEEVGEKHVQREQRWEDEIAKHYNYALTCYYILPILYPGLDWNTEAIDNFMDDEEIRSAIARKIGVQGYRSIADKPVLATSAVKGRAVELKQKLQKDHKKSGPALMLKYFQQEKRAFRVKNTDASKLFHKAYELAKPKNNVMALCELLALNDIAGPNDFVLPYGDRMTKRFIKDAAVALKFEIANSKLEYQVLAKKTAPAAKKEEAQPATT